MHLLPPNSTPQERALSRATARVLSVPTSPIKTLWSPYTCPAAVLPWLAWSLSVEPWKSDWSESSKRAAIAASIETHRIKGTVGAVRRALATLGFEVEIDERTGAAYTFRLLVDAEARGYTEDDYDEAEAAAIASKNARSHLTGVLSMVKRTGTLLARAVLADGDTSETEAYFDSHPTHSGALRCLSALTGLDTVTVFPGVFDGFTASAEILSASSFTTVDYASN